MQFRITDTFISSLAKLANDEQKAVKTTAFDLQLNPAQPGMQFHKLDRAKDKRFWSVRVNRDVRVIVHRTDASLMLCYVGHHDDAYAWAERRKLETHPKTGAAQIVEVRETVREVAVPRYVESPEAAADAAEPAAKPLLFANVPDDQLLGYGVPKSWLTSVKAADEDGVFDLIEHLPAEAGEALLALAVGETPAAGAAAEATSDPFEHPDAKRRFQLVASSDALQRALAYPWDRWAVFLHPSQREVVEGQFNGPARVAGSAGTGKTVVALHRAVELARRYPDAQVLVTTFSIALARMLRAKLRRLVDGDASIEKRLSVRAIDEVGLDVYASAAGSPRIATPGMVRRLVEQAAGAVAGHRFTTHFLLSEWTDVVDAWQLDSWEAYRDVPRLGRKTRLGEKQRQTIWQIFEQVRRGLDAGGLVTMAGVFAEATRLLSEGADAPATHVVVDEAQDVSVPQLRFLAALAGERADGLFFAGDLGQRIFQTPFSWKALGVDIRGRSRVLKVNYRTSHQIRELADRLLAGEVSDVDGATDDRRGTVSAFAGPEPTIELFDDEQAEIERVGAWLGEQIKAGTELHEVGVFVRSEAELKRAMAAVRCAGVKMSRLDNRSEPSEGAVALGLMHDAKGLEFRAVAVMACDDEVLPLQSRIEAIGDEADLEVTYETERHLLYVACTRARDHLLVTGVEPGSEFLADIQSRAGMSH